MSNKKLHGHNVEYIYKDRKYMLQKYHKVELNTFDNILKEIENLSRDCLRNAEKYIKRGWKSMLWRILFYFFVQNRDQFFGPQTRGEVFSIL